MASIYCRAYFTDRFVCIWSIYHNQRELQRRRSVRASNIELGLDLAGGVSITYEVDGKNVSDSDMKDTVYKLQKRVEGYSTEAEVYQEGKDRINIRDSWSDRCKQDFR